MQAEITYIFHNCFILKLENRVFLFDYPADQFLTEEMRQIVAEKIKDCDLFILASHSHPDHFNPQLDELIKINPRVFVILSHDIIAAHPGLRPDAATLICMPEQSYQIAGMELITLKSNDLGLAFLISWQGKNIYFGGDLADWKWEECSHEECSHEECHTLSDRFHEELKRIQQIPIAIAFSNTDQRLPNWAGAAELIQTVQPRLFVPMHTFGETASLTRFKNEFPELAAEVFWYQKTGDSVNIEL